MPAITTDAHAETQDQPGGGNTVTTNNLPFPVSRLAAVNVSQVPKRSPLRYPGGKTWLIPHVREWLTRTRPKILIEPFAGGGVVSLTGVMEGLVERCVMIEINHDVPPSGTPPDATRRVSASASNASP